MQALGWFASSLRCLPYGKLRSPKYDRGDFVFQLASRTPPAQSARPAAPGADNEGLFWSTIKDSTDPAMFEEYKRQFPNGQFVGLADLCRRLIKDTGCCL